MRALRDLVSTLAFLALMTGAVLLAWYWSGDPLSGRPRVVDGDTIVLSDERLRLRGIDAPERGQSCRKGLRRIDCGARATEALKRLVRGGVDCDGERIDRYGRRLVRCVAEGVDVNAEMVRRGWAVSYRGHSSEEAEARAAGRGLWAYEFERPADHRRAKRERSWWDALAGLFS